MWSLRPYQVDAIERASAALSARRRAVLVSPTGSGKTIMAAEIMRRAVQRGHRCLFLVHRIELLTQTAEKLKEAGCQFGIIKAGIEEDRAPAIQLAAVQTLVRRKFPPADLVICDEAHRGDYQKVTVQYPQAWILGLTATPERLGGKTLHGEYDTLVEGITYSQLIKAGFIVPPRIWAPSTPDLKYARILAGDYHEDDLEKVMNNSKVVGDVVSQWLKHAQGSQTLVYAVNIRHAEALEAGFRKVDAEVGLITGATDAATRASLMSSFRNRVLRVMVNVGVFVEGLDVPGVETIVMARPTKSLPLYMQMAGRGCRPAPGKTWYRLLDHAGNSILHGPPHIDREWSIQPNEEGRAPAKREITVKRCKTCLAVALATEWLDNQCPACGWFQESKPVRYVQGELVETEAKVIEKAAKVIGPEEKERRRLWAIARATKVTNPNHYVSTCMRQWRRDNCRISTSGVSIAHEDLW